MTRDELMTLLMTHWPHGEDPVPVIRRGHYYHLGTALGRRPDSPPLDHLDDPDARLRCPECATWEGSLHVPGCDIERCGVCGRQLSSCDCPRSADTPRVPYIHWPLVCARCGGLWPRLFRVPEAEWAHYIQINRQRAVVCQPCYDTIKAWIDTGPQQPPPTQLTR
jgi:hypothetical protein